MLRTLLAILRSSWLLELGGAGLLIAAAAIAWGLAAALAVGGGCLILKSAEPEVRQ